MHTIKTTPKIAAMMVVVLFGFALIAAPKVHPRKKIMNAMHTRTAGLISWLMVKLPVVHQFSFSVCRLSA
ncbi:hypothetical protein F7754_01175 [Salmonella enterica subsp. enterica]|nr:hypothetical protein [Salmonella enterica subsp. enterica serovar Eastbourne]